MENIMPLTYIKEVLNFICLVNYYHNKWTRHSHMLDSLTKLMPSKVKLKWTEVEQRAFKETNNIENHNIVLSYPNIKKEFTIHTISIYFQLEVVIRI